MSTCFRSIIDCSQWCHITEKLVVHGPCKALSLAMKYMYILNASHLCENCYGIIKFFVFSFGFSLVAAGIGKNSTKDDPSSVTITYLEFAEKLDKKKSLNLSFQFEFSSSDQDRIRKSLNPGVTFITVAVLEMGLFKIGDFSSLEASLKRHGVTLDVHQC